MDCAAGRSKHKADDQRGGDSCRCILPHSFHVLPSYTHSSDVLQIIISLLGESNPPGGVKGSDHSVQIRYRSEKHQRRAVRPAPHKKTKLCSHRRKRESLIFEVPHLSYNLQAAAREENQEQYLVLRSSNPQPTVCKAGVIIATIAIRNTKSN